MTTEDANTVPGDTVPGETVLVWNGLVAEPPRPAEGGAKLVRALGETAGREDDADTDPVHVVQVRRP